MCLMIIKQFISFTSDYENYFVYKSDFNSILFLKLDKSITFFILELNN